MSNSTQLEFKCPTCSKKTGTLGEFQANGQKFYIYKCGHFGAISIKQADKYDTFQSLEGDKPYPFQLDGIKFIEQSTGRALIADEMGLGKTIQALGWLYLHPEASPVLFVVKKKLTLQFFKQIYRWCDKSMSQIINQGQAILPGLKYYIISMDLIRNYPLERLAKLGLKTIVIDECQHIKNPDSQRTHFLRKLIKDNDIPNILALSGTPFKNRLSEYFTILNILAPQYFAVKEEFIRNEISFYYDSAGKLRERGLRNPKRFRNITKNFILRRNREEVEDQIPFIGIQRNLEYVDLDGKFKEAYDNAQEEFLELFSKIENERNSMQRNSDLLAILQRMRHIVGLNKIPDTVDFVTDFLLSTYRKIAIAVHHQDVARMMIEQLDRWCTMGGFGKVLQIKGSMQDEELNKVVELFNAKNNHRILIASTLAAGEGLNLQEACNECIIMEHQWNAANEEQFEARFRRIGQKERNVTATYMVAGATIDEMLVDIKERKRALVKNGMGGNYVPYTESEMIAQLAEAMEANRAKKLGKGNKK